MRAYAQAGVTLKVNDPRREATKDLQRDLRALGYLRKGIDGNFGSDTDLAVRALQHDLLSNGGLSEGGDGNAPVRMIDYNRQRVNAVSGVLEPGLAACMIDMLDDRNFPKLPFSDDPAADNAKALSSVKSLPSLPLPLPFLLAILGQESNCHHFSIPDNVSDDNFIVVGLDRNGAENHIITSRGYGMGQYTLFHHPPRLEEIANFMVDPKGNVSAAIRELRDKFDHFVLSKAPNQCADDRVAEHGQIPLRVCDRFPQADNANYMRSCQTCMREAGTQNIEAGVTPFYAGSTEKFAPTGPHPETNYEGVPVRAKISCDWPYAARRYNGSGINSYHYQAQVLLRLK